MSMKKYIYMILALAVLSCQKGEQMSQVASRFSIELDEFVDADGGTSSRKWEAGDKVGMLCMVDGKAEKIVAPVLMEGRGEGLFMFNWSEYEQGREMTFFFPSDAAVSMGDEGVEIEVPVEQDGSFNQLFVADGKSNGSSFMDVKMMLQPYWHIFSVQLVKGDYTVEKAKFMSNQHEITVTFPSPLDCREAVHTFYISLPQMTLAEGYTIVFTTTDNETFVVRSSDELVLKAGKMTQIKDARFPSEIVVCGSSMIYILDTDKVRTGGFEDAVTWSWDAQSVADIVGGAMDHLDECKVVDNGTRILATSSYSWAVLVDIATNELLWWSKSLKSAHSADLLPGGRIVVACSGADNGLGDRLQVLDRNVPNKVFSYVDLPSAHGVVWNEATERLYAVGGSSLNIYKLKNWDTDLPELELESSVDVSDYVTGLHDLTLADDNTLLLAGKKAALYNISRGTLARLPHFSNSTALKSVNYNPVTGECWYTDATDPEYQAGHDWATNTVFYTSSVVGSNIDLKIAVPEGFDMYKVRVRKW